MFLSHSEISTLNEEKEMSGAIRVKENIQGQDTVLKIFEKILKKKLDLILKEKSTCHTILEIEKIKADYLQK